MYDSLLTQAGASSLVLNSVFLNTRIIITITSVPALPLKALAGKRITVKVGLFGNGLTGCKITRVHEAVRHDHDYDIPSGLSSQWCSAWAVVDGHTFVEVWFAAKLSVNRKVGCLWSSRKYCH